MSASFCDNPKTNLTYEKNLYILQLKFHAKSYANLKTVNVIKKYF